MLLQSLPQTYDETTIQIVWTIGLILALIVTVIDVSLVIRVIRAARRIDELAARTLPAAGGIAHNTAAIAKLNATLGVAKSLVEKAGPIVNVADAMEKKLAAVAAHFGGRRY
ncbi:MAG TPA: hypothetical protein VFZ34_08880 [Blastocatellia bacterium]|nr:hypothetical protein [Blastocatellia bacterium]